MFKAIGRWFKALGYYITGNVDAARRTLDTNPNVLRAKYDSIAADKTRSIQQYKQAVAGLIAQQEKKLSRLKELTAEVEKLERLKAGALAKARQRIEQLQGKSKAEVQADADYMKCLGAYNDFVAALTEKQARIEELEGDVRNYDTSIKDHKIQLQTLLRDLDKLKGEAHEAVAEMITARQEQEIADTIAGIAEDGSAEELQRLRQLRAEVKAAARVSKELAGTDGKAQEAEFMEYARQSVANDEFERLVGLAEAADAPSKSDEAAAPERTGGLPE